MYGNLAKGRKYQILFMIGSNGWCRCVRSGFQVLLLSVCVYTVTMPVGVADSHDAFELMWCVV